MAVESASSAVFGGRAPARLSAQLSRTAVALLLAVAVAALVGLLWTTRQSDDVSVERQMRVARHSINIALDELALQQETVAIWDNSALEMTRARPDQQWLFDNMGSWLHRMFGHDEVHLVDGHNRPVQSVVAGKRVPTRRFHQLGKDFDLLLHSVRGEVREPGAHDRIPPHPLHPQASVMTTERATHDTHLMLIGGRPAVASAMLIKPSTTDYVRPSGNWPVIISVRYLDGGFMRQLQSRYLLDGARFSASPDRDSSEQALPLETEWHEPLGYLIWTPELPGSRILGILLPWCIAGLAALALLTILLTRSLRQTLDERSQFEARAAHLAFHDSLTGLPNRALLNERLQRSLARPREGGAAALLLLDLDRFKQVNDTLGHLAGDQLIRDFAARLQRLVRSSDTVARLGGDEFAVVLCNEWDRDGIDEICKAIIGLFRAPFLLSDTKVFGGASIGAAFVEESVGDSTELMRRADVALYRAKADGRGCARVYETGMDESDKARARLEADLRQALESGLLFAWRQPQVDRDGRVVGHELLLRWRHPQHGWISGGDIIPLAEETGLILPIGGWMLRQAAIAAAQSPDLFTAVNLSPVQLAEADFAERTIALFEAAGADPQTVELEVTERVMLDESGMAGDNIQALRTAGFRIALDDFGTGYSSLSYLRKLAIDKLKIDRSFVADLQHSRDARAIIGAIVTMGRAIGLTVCAEGVETRSQAEILTAAGCDQLQGFLFGAPVDLAGEPGERAAG